MLKVFGFFVAGMFFSGNLFIAPLGVAPLLFITAFTGLEILVAFLQAYVFAILTCIYLNDAIHMH
jgi:F-type H+-transporting ATPase subunit a